MFYFKLVQSPKREHGYKGAYDSIQRFEIEALKDVVEKFLIGTILHEHLSIHSIYSLVPFLNEFGLNLIGIKHVSNIQGGAIVGVAIKENKKTISDEMFDTANSITDVSRTANLYGRLLAIKDMQIHLLEQEKMLKEKIESEERV